MKVGIRLDKRYKHGNGKYPVKITVAYAKTTLYIKTGIELKESEWNQNAKNQNYVQCLPNRTALNMYLKEYLIKIEQRVRDMQLNGEVRLLTRAQFLKKLEGTKEQDEKTVAQVAIEYCKNNTPRTEAIKALGNFINLNNLYFSEIDTTLLQRFIENEKNRGMKHNTIVVYMEKIRAFINFARKHGYKCNAIDIHLKTKATAKRSLEVSDIRRLIQEPKNKKEQKYFDIFLLMLYMRGINTRDICELKLSNIRYGYIVYERHKTGKHIEIKIEPEIDEILRRYKGKEYLLSIYDREDRVQYGKAFARTMKNHLCKICARCGIDVEITAYWARHTWASLAIEVGIDISYVSAGLSHSYGAQITQTYIMYRQRKIDEASRKVIDYIINKCE